MNRVSLPCSETKSVWFCQASPSGMLSLRATTTGLCDPRAATTTSPVSSVTYSRLSGPQAMAVGCSRPAANVET